MSLERDIAEPSGIAGRVGIVGQAPSGANLSRTKAPRSEVSPQGASDRLPSSEPTRPSPPRKGRPPSCVCGECRKCKHRVYMRRWWSGHSLEGKREKLARRDRERRKAYNAQWRQDNPEAAAAIDKRYYERHKDAVRAKNLRRSQTEKGRAGQAVRDAVRSGQLVKPEDCESCGSKAALQGHHEDYSKPLEVKWLCSRCHGLEHRGVAA